MIMLNLQMVMTGTGGRKMRKKGLETCHNTSPLFFGSYFIYYHTLLLLCFQNFNKTAQMAELISKKVQKSGPGYTQITERKSCREVVPVTHKMAIKV